MYLTGMEMREIDMSDSETEFLLNPERDHQRSNNGNVASIDSHQSHRNRRKRVRKLGTILRFTCG